MFLFQENKLYGVKKPFALILWLHAAVHHVTNTNVLLTKKQNKKHLNVHSMDLVNVLIYCFHAWIRFMYFIFKKNYNGFGIFFSDIAIRVITKKLLS